MNLKRTIKKIKGALNMDSEFCRCDFNQRMEVLIQDLTEDSEDTTPRVMGEPLPDRCRACGKPTDKNTITVRICDLTTALHHAEMMGNL